MTSYEVVFKPFLRRISDPLFSELSETLSEEEMIMIMDAAILKFNYPKVNLKNKNDTTKEFDGDLGFDEIQILSFLMVVEWLSPVLYDITLLKRDMSSKEYQTFSSSAKIISLRKLYELAVSESKSLLVNYSKRDGDSSGLGKLRSE
jgi:hypothetical protein